jgi:cytochrome c553
MPRLLSTIVKALSRALSTVVPLLAGMIQAAAANPAPSFDRDVRPILKAACTHCHGEEEDLAGGVDLRLRRFMDRPGDSGEAVVVPGRPEESLLVRVIASGEMPQDGKPLDAASLDLIRAWIAAGALADAAEPESLPPGAYVSESERRHWAFQPIVDPPVPPAGPGDRVRTPIDAFLAARLREAGLAFAADANRRTLIRRVSLDLTGLVPMADEVERFVADSSADAYERLVERLLDSPAYAERWARHWLDAVGYADSNGHAEADSPRPHAWRYRDYVIRAIAADKPWDAFLVEQLAGDELAAVVHGETADAAQDPVRLEQLVATGFLRMAPDGTGDGLPDAALARNEVIAEQLKVVSSAVLGLTVGCAQCHDHRIDPIPQVDYYRLRAVFEPAFDTAHWRVPAQRLCSLATPEDRARAAEIETQAVAIEADAKALERKFLDEIFEKEVLKLPEADREPYRAARGVAKEKRTPEQEALIKKYPSALALHSLELYDREAQKKVVARREEAKKLRETKPREEFVMALTEERGRIPTTHILHRGDHGQPRGVVGPGELSVIAGTAIEPFVPAPVSSGSSGRRLAYARWLTGGHHPLVARVLVNRFWMHHFGRGIVATPGDFGLAGARPSHPQLLDWLARRFMEGGWSLKALHRLVVASTAYRQASHHPAALAADPDNALVGRWSVRRLDAESLRDSVLLAAGRLSPKAGGPPVAIGRDPVGRVTEGKEELNANGDVTRLASVGEDALRRSIYTTFRRSTPLTLLDTFDAPTMLPNCEQRNCSTVAPQSLFMLNDAFVLEHALALAGRLRQERPGDLRGQIERAWLVLTARAPDEAELVEGLVHVAEQAEALRATHAAHPPAKDAPAADPQAEALASYCQVLLSCTRFLYVD